MCCGLKSWQTYLLKTTVTSSGMFGVPVLGGPAKTNWERDGEMEKERPNSTFDPRGRCHGYRMVWERVQDKPKEQEKKERPKGSLSLPLTRSVSSLSPLVLRKKWRKRSSKTDTEEWDGGGRNFSRNVMEESDDEEVRRRSVCGIVGEQRAKRDRLADELCSNKDHNTHPKISVVVSSSIDSNVFEKEHTETSLNQQKDNLEKTRGDEKERTTGCVVEESIQTHDHIQDTNQDAQCTETQGHQVEQNIEKDKIKMIRTQKHQQIKMNRIQTIRHVKMNRLWRLRAFRAMWRKYITGRRHTDWLQ